MPTRAPAHILIVEDEPVTRATLTGYLEDNGYRISQAADAAAAEELMARDPADLLLIDITLEGKDGLQLTRELRTQSEVGIVLISGRTDDVDRIVGLEMGADDYVCKPFNRRELLARIKNLLRRTLALRHLGRTVFRFEGFTFDLGTRHLVCPDGTAVRLTRAEFEILSRLVRHAAEVQSRDALMSCVSLRHDSPEPRTVDVLIRRLRRKLGDDPRAPRIIATSHGEGYVFTGRLD